MDPRLQRSHRLSSSTSGVALRVNIADLHGVVSTMINVKRTLCAVSMISALGASNHAGATFSFSDVTIPSDSVPLMIDKDIRGYAPSSGPLTDNDQFLVLSEGDFWNGVLMHSPIARSMSDFDAATMTDPGSTASLGTDTPYTSWVHHSSSLASATASLRSEPVLHGSAVFGPILKLETLVMLLIASLGLMGFVMHHRRQAAAGT